MRLATYRIPRKGLAAGTAANLVLHVAELMGRGDRAGARWPVDPKRGRLAIRGRAGGGVVKIAGSTSARRPSRRRWSTATGSSGATTSGTTPARPRRCSSSSSAWSPRPASTPGADRVFVTGSGAGSITGLIGGKYVQEVVAVAACVERLHPEVRFVSEIGGEDMKTIFFTDAGAGKSKQVYMQSACSGGTGTFIEKTARKLQVASERLAAMPYAGLSLHKISSKCGIFAETDANTLVKTGVPVEEIIASLFEAVVYQNLATLDQGQHARCPRSSSWAGPTSSSRGSRRRGAIT